MAETPSTSAMPAIAMGAALLKSGAALLKSLPTGPNILPILRRGPPPPGSAGSPILSFKEPRRSKPFEARPERDATPFEARRPREPRPEDARPAKLALPLAASPPSVDVTEEVKEPKVVRA